MNLKKKRTEILRSDPEFKKFVDELSRVKSFEEKDRIAPSRITQAMLNQYKKYPELLREIRKTKLGKWKSR